MARKRFISVGILVFSTKENINAKSNCIEARKILGTNTVKYVKLNTKQIAIGAI